VPTDLFISKDEIEAWNFYKSSSDDLLQGYNEHKSLTDNLVSSIDTSFSAALRYLNLTLKQYKLS
jgi:hypothetical protein